MIFQETELKGAFLIDLDRKQDERGFFARSFCENELAAHGLATHCVQCNLSYNAAAGTLRGMHFQVAPHEEAKLIRVTRGAIYDVIVDLRPQSPTYLKWIAVRLDQDNRRMLYVPEGFAHGFQTLVPETEVFYQMFAFFDASSARGLRWDDPDLNLAWPDAPIRIISQKDREYPLLSEGALGTPR